MALEEQDTRLSRNGSDIFENVDTDVVLVVLLPPRIQIPITSVTSKCKLYYLFVVMQLFHSTIKYVIYKVRRLRTYIYPE